MKQKTPRSVILVILLILTIGILYRIEAFGWNTRLQGDVNLFALTAREIVNHNRLFYPMKYEYSDQVDYLTLQDPASQHPPLFPLTAGLLGKFFKSNDTFFFLKFISLAAGITLLIVITFLGIWHDRYFEATLGLLLISISPTITDYSANGSPYIISALIVVLATYLITIFRYERLSYYVLVALLSGLGLQIHGAMIAIPIAIALVWLLNLKQLRWSGVLLTAVLGLFVLTPWIKWTYSHFGQFFYSYSAIYLQMQWGYVVEGVFGDVVTYQVVSDVDVPFIQKYCSLAIQNYVRFWIMHLMEVGPFCWVLILGQSWYLFRLNKSTALQKTIPLVLYSLMPALTTLVRPRFIVPILPLTYLIAAWGFARLLRHHRRLAVTSLAGTILWLVPQYLETPPTRYYVNDYQLAQKYAQMVDLSTALSERDSGVVLGFSAGLDGGIETIYWHGFPFIRGRPNSPTLHEAYPGEMLHKLADDFEVRYIWTDEATVEEIEKFFPTATRILSQKPFYVYERPEARPTRE